MVINNKSVNFIFQEERASFDRRSGQCHQGLADHCRDAQTGMLINISYLQKEKNKIAIKDASVARSISS